MCYRDINYYAGNCIKANQKTLLHKMVINNEKAIIVKPAVFLKKISPTNLENL